ncbi:MAG: hypothetical protein KAX93_04535 [Flavobacterium sp.]|nr:hypothetical protein [Flavobacterium sp.]MBP8157624.1 hypothetical protein [Flavobacterium sp.]
MKKLLLAFFMLFGLTTMAQSTDLDPFDLYYSYVSLPAKPILEKKNRTYSFVTNIDRNLQYSKSKYFIENQVTISGFEKKEKNGYLSIEVVLQNPVITKKDITTRTSSSKDKNGRVTNKYYYTVEYSYSQDGNAKVVSNDGKVNKIINFTGQKSSKSQEYESYSQAESFQYSIYNLIRNNYATEVVNTMNNQLNDEFGYPVKTGMDKLWILANKKHPEQLPEYNAYLTVKNAFERMNFAEPTADIETEVKDAIAYFESLPTKYGEDEKAHRKIRYSAYFNLAKIYSLLDKPAKSNEYCQKLIANDYDKFDGETMLKTNNEMLTLFKANQITNRHFSVETKNFVFEEKQAVYSNNTSSAPSSDAPYSIETDQNYILAYMLTIKKDTIAGYMHKSRSMNLSEAVTVTVKDFQGKFSERNFKANELSRLILSNGEEYATVAFRVSVDNGGMTMASATKKFAKEMFVGKKISVYQYFNGEVIIKMANDSEGKSNASAGWMLGPKKRFEEMAKTCPSLQEKIDRKEFKNNLESIISFAEALEACK